MRHEDVSKHLLQNAYTPTLPQDLIYFASFGIIMVSCWESFWDYCGLSLGSLWDHFGVILGSLWDQFVM